MRTQDSEATSPLRWHRTVATALAILFTIIAGWTWLLVYSELKATDFLSYWAAARLLADGAPSAAYDIEAHRAVELSVASVADLLPFAYPPPFLLLLAPVALAPYWLAFGMWVAFTAGAYLLVSRGIAPIAYRLAHPQALANALTGQNGFLTTAVFIAGTTALQRRPVVGGAILGLMVIKPQLALLLPVALLAGREWKAMLGAAASSLGLLLLALLLLGTGTYTGFLENLPAQASLLASDRIPWNELASTFAFARHLGVPERMALVIHALFAIAAAILVWRAWSKNSEKRVPLLAAAMLLAPPYLFTYDALLLIVPLGWLIRRKEQPIAIGLVWILCMLPILTYAGFYTGPNTVPVAALLCLWALQRHERRT